MPLLPLDDAVAHVLGACERLPVSRLPLDEALGCVLAEPVIAAEPVPPFANTAMDGFAVRAADVATTPAHLRVVATLPAGAAPDRAVGPGDAVRIMTGAPIPDGADAIVPVENTSAWGSPESAGAATVVVNQPACVGDCIRPAGEDVALGQVVFAAGTLLQAGHLGVLASIGVRAVDVYRRPRVGVLSTGDELVEPPRPLRVGQIRDSNRHTLLALLQQSGCEAVDLGIARDDEAVIEAALEAAAETCDAVLTSGGVSVGDFDYSKRVLDRLSGGTMRWMQIAIKPAKPFAFGTIPGPPGERRPVFGLPGNPVSSMVSFELLARPALRKMLGVAPAQCRRPALRGVAAERLVRQPDGKIHFARVRARYEDGRFLVSSAGGQASNLLRAMALANALAVLPDGGPIGAGEPVAFLLLGELEAGAAG